MPDGEVAMTVVDLSVMEGLGLAAQQLVVRDMVLMKEGEGMSKDQGETQNEQNEGGKEHAKMNLGKRGVGTKMFHLEMYAGKGGPHVP